MTDIDPIGKKFNEAIQPTSPSDVENAEQESFCCSFCGRASFECQHIQQGPNAAICSECCLLFLGVMLHEFPQVDPESKQDLEESAAERREKPWLEMGKDGSFAVYGGETK